MGAGSTAVDRNTVGIGNNVLWPVPEEGVVGIVGDKFGGKFVEEVAEAWNCNAGVVDCCRLDVVGNGFPRLG